MIHRLSSPLVEMPRCFARARRERRSRMLRRNTFRRASRRQRNGGKRRSPAITAGQPSVGKLSRNIHADSWGRNGDCARGSAPRGFGHVA